MAKRATGAADGPAAFNKRRKTSHQGHAVPAAEDVQSVEQLRKLLAFDQDLQRSRHGLQSLKKLLDDIKSKHPDQGPKLGILRGYLEATKPRHMDEDAVFLPDIMEMWSFAAQVDNDGVMSSVAVVLALILQLISHSLELVPYGLGICRTLLQERQLKSFSKNLSSDKSKAFVLSPTLRLLRETVSLDGGAYARRVFRERVYTFACLGRNLEIGPGEGQEDTHTTSVRTNAVRFVLSCLTYLHSAGKRELLAQRELFSHLTFMIRADPPHLVMETLDVLKTRVLTDEKIPREVKFRCFNTKTLMRLLALYNYANVADESGLGDSVREAAHSFLIYLCTTPRAGILYPSTGLYPKQHPADSMPGPAVPTYPGGDVTADVWEVKYKDAIPVFNFVLSEFARKLRPWSSLTQSQLLVSIFKAAPELVADYFLNNRSFTFEPKLSMTWIGYAAFLLDTISIALPPDLGDGARFAKSPPPVSILLDNILPLPINQKVLVRCFAPNSHLISMFATRILLAALQKLAAALTMLERASGSQNQSLGAEASRRLIDAFCQRIPEMKEVVRSYKSVPSENILHRSLVSRLLRAYYEVIPQMALAANFDVAPYLVEVLRKLDEDQSGPQDRALRTIELENLVSIAGYSPGMRWFSKVDDPRIGQPCTSFTALLRLFCENTDIASLPQLQAVLTAVATENQLVCSESKLHPLCRSLRSVTSKVKAADMEPVWSFLDNCVARCATSPIRYLDCLENVAEECGIQIGDAPVSLLTVCVVEQLPYAITAKLCKGFSPVVTFLSFYFNALTLSQESQDLVKDLYRRAGEHLSATPGTMDKLGSKAVIRSLRSHDEAQDDETVRVDDAARTQVQLLGHDDLEEALHVPFATDGVGDDATVLIRWTAKTVEDLIEDNWIARLIRLLNSPHINIRKECLTNILKMAAKIKDSHYEERDQAWLLLCEVAESARPHLDAGPVPSAFAAFATHALDVLNTPLHPLYPKVNAFLTRGPVWPADKLPLAHDILHGEPSQDDRYYTELAWLLAYLLDSLRTPFDLGVFHNKRWFEKVLALASNPYLRSGLRTRILRLVYRALRIQGGSTTLITRFGILSWLDAQRARSDVAGERAVYAALMNMAWETCDQTRVAEWSKGGAERLLASLS